MTTDGTAPDGAKKRRSAKVVTGLLLVSLAPALAACGDSDTADSVQSSTPPIAEAPVQATEMVDARIVDRLPEDPSLRFSSYDECAVAIGADNCDGAPATEAQGQALVAGSSGGADGSWTDSSSSGGGHAVYVPSYGYHGYYPVFSGGSARVAAPARAGVSVVSAARAGVSASSAAVSASARGGFGGIGAAAVAGGGGE